jgi:lipoprotein-anchoring transpeptidase ErfK/SrfK
MMIVRRTAFVMAVVALAALAGGCSAHHPAALAPKTRPVVHKVVVTAVQAPAGTTLVATTKGAIPGSPAPGAPSNVVVPGSWYGYPSILPVIDSAPNWVEVRLAQRPNESTTWVPQSDVTLADTPYTIDVDLATRHLTVLHDGQPTLSFPVGIGVPNTPTVTGNFFVAMKVAPPSAGYGPFVLVTSAHSDAITDWEQSGDAIIAIHGPISSSADAEIGTTGAAISNGCIRMHDADLAQLADIPAGTPVDISAT